MTTCTIKQRLALGATVTMVNPNYPAPGLVETLCRAGADAVLIDCEHGPSNMESVENMIRAAHLAGASAIVRPETNEPWLIIRYMNRGADGVLVPLVHDAALARRAVDAVRAACPRDHADKLTMVLIESREAVDNLPELLGIDGIDAFFVGPADMAASIGRALERDHPEVRQLVSRAIETVVAAGRIVGTIAPPTKKATLVAQGVRLLYIHADTFIRDGLAAYVGNDGRSA
jgi:2-keto-3-deoxy-L-rhamnonate aldolase RhmA